MTKLAASSGTVLYESGNKVYIQKRPAQWTPVFLFVTGLLAVILLVNGLMQWLIFGDGSKDVEQLGMILTGTGLLFTLVFWRVWIYRKKTRAIPPGVLATIAILDFGSGNLLDGQQNIIAPLDQVWLQRKMQIGSSSPELILHWNGGNTSIVKGSPFAGGITSIEMALLGKGFRKK